MAIKINGVTVIDDSRVGNLAAANVTGNVTGGNLTTTGEISASGNITGNFIFGNGSQLTGIDATSIQNGTANVRTFNNANVTVSAAGNANIGVFTGTGLIVSGSIEATNGFIGLDATSIANGSANVRTFLDGNVTMSAANTANVVTVTSTGANITGTLNATGNANVGNIGATNGEFTNISGTLTTAAQTNITSLGTLGSLSVTGNVTTGNVSGTLLTGTLATAAQPNVTSVGTLSSLSVTGNVTGGNLTTAGQVSATGNITGGNLLINNNAVISGNLNVLGTETIFNVQTLTVNDLDIIVANNVTGGANINGAGILAGNPTTASFVYNNATSSWQVNVALTPNANGTLDLGKTGSRWGNAWLSTLTVTGNANVGNIGATNIVGTLTTAAQTNITSLGTLSSLSVTGNVTTGNVSGTLLTGTLATAAQPNVTSLGTLSSLSVTGNVTTGNVSGTLLTGTLATAAQPNVTSVGTLTSLSVTGNANVGNLGTAGLITATGNVSGGNLTTGAQVVATGNVTGGNLNTAGIFTSTKTGGTANANAQIYLNGATLNRMDFNTNGVAAPAFTTRSAGAKIVLYPSISASAADYALGIESGNMWFGVPTTSEQFRWYAGTTLGLTLANGVLTAVGNVSGSNLVTAGRVVATGNVEGGNLITAGLVSLSSITKTGTNGVGNIGSSTSTFNTIFAKATSAQYADLAEVYEADDDYEPGTVVAFGGVREVTVSLVENDKRVAGVISTAPSYIMNSALESEHTATVALTGRVPTRVSGAVNKGDMMVSAGDGSARACATPQIGTVIGKALEDFSGESGVIEVVVGRL